MADLLGGLRRTWRFPVSAGRSSYTEAAWLAAHLWRYPWGLAGARRRASGLYHAHRTAGLTPRARSLVVSNMHEAATPVLLVHGIADNRSVFSVLQPALRRRGYGVVHAVNLYRHLLGRGEIRGAAEELSHQVEQVLAETGADTVHLIGHSLGGLVARYYVQRLGGHRRVDAVVTMGSAHHGSMVAHVLPPTPLIRQFRPGSDLLAELAEPAPGCSTRFLSVWSHGDPMMMPRRCARLEHADLDTEDVELDHVGHISMVSDPEVLHRITSWLNRADAERIRPTAADAIGG